MLHAGFLPEPGDPDRKPFLDTLAKVSDLAKAKGITVAFETGQETADLLRRTLDELKCPNLKVNFDPANMLLYDKGDPIRAVEILGPDIRSVHVKDANRADDARRTGARRCRWARARSTSAGSSRRSKKVGYRGPLCIEREVGDQEQRVADIAHGIRYPARVPGRDKRRVGTVNARVPVKGRRAQAPRQPRRAGSTSHMSDHTAAPPRAVAQFTTR